MRKKEEVSVRRSMEVRVGVLGCRSLLDQKESLSPEKLKRATWEGVGSEESVCLEGGRAEGH